MADSDARVFHFISGKERLKGLFLQPGFDSPFRDLKQRLDWRITFFWKFTHTSKNYLPVQGDIRGGNFGLFSKLIFKAFPEVPQLLSVWILIKNPMNLHKT